MTRVRVELAPADLRRVRARAKRDGVSMGQVVARALASMFTQQDSVERAAREAEDLLGEEEKS